ncbi:hypothetical protein BTI84_05740 [Lactobacillus delbrueckii subsp. bulgaricus]|nr:hypothetical protein [Lactobacillus delbrueckii subsp. bulgaricus]MBT9010875.1 hypothetical protein [Lactobacillus delbrueckii subsp. bulgaricus]MBT9017398.1 hypothetical protein [Lactobacillus delbrueckii subsp. bulgaricus]MBT9041250.1 hypothetical protein [Lactobacillus delbrueckii subsp. bulgaricus]
MPGHAGTGGRDVIFAWEQCKLGDVAKINSGKDYKGLQPGKIPVYGTGGYMLSVNDKLSDIDAIGIGRKGTIDKPYYLNAPFWTVDTLFYVTPRGTADISFMFPLFKNINWKRYDESTGVPSLSKNTIKKIRVSFPQNNEQVKIGDLFQKITQIITLHEEKKRQLERLKNALLQKMFADKSGYPVVRFEGFSDEWEQCKVKDIFKITRGKVLAATEISEEKSDISPFPVYSSQTKNNGLMGYYKDYLFDTAITWTTDGANAGTVSYRSGRFYSTNVNGVLISDKGYANKAISEILNLEAWKWVSHVGNPKLMNNVMGDISIMIPSSFEEQDRLSDFLNQLDDTITLHDQKLNLLKLVKQSLLQNMFI